MQALYTFGPAIIMLVSDLLTYTVLCLDPEAKGTSGQIIAVTKYKYNADMTAAAECTYQMIKSRCIACSAAC